MRKEILFAIIAGVVIGTALAFGIWRANSSLKSKGEEVLSVPTKEEVESPETEFKIALAKPEDYDVITKSPTALSGITEPNTWIAISSEEDDYILKSDSKGAFEQEVELVGGVNQLLVYAFDENGSSSKKDLIVVFSTKFEKQEGSSEQESKE